MKQTVPDFSIVVPVLHEQNTIGRFVDDLESIHQFDRCELVVVDGDPGGGTVGEIEGGRAVTLISPPGRSRQMNAGAAASIGRVLVFLHADTRLPAGALTDIDGALAGGAADAGAFRLAFDSPRFVYRLIAATATLRSRWRLLPYGDQALFIRRRLFENLGGFADIPVLEDVDLVGRIRRSGAGLTILDSAVRTSTRRLDSEGIVRRVTLNWILMILYNLGVSPHRLARFYPAGR